MSVAAKFAITVTRPVTNRTLTTAINATCSALTDTVYPGSIINGACTWQRKLRTPNESISQLFDICNGMFHDSIGNYGYL